MIDTGLVVNCYKCKRRIEGDEWLDGITDRPGVEKQVKRFKCRHCGHEMWSGILTVARYEKPRRKGRR